MVGGAVGGWDGGDSVVSRGSSDGGVGSVSTAGVSFVSAARVATVTAARVTTVTAAVIASVATSVAARVVLLFLVVLSDLDGLLDVIELDSDDPVVGHAVDGGGGAVVGWQVTVAVAVTLVGGGNSLVLDLVLQDDVLDLFKEMGVDVVALGGLMADRDAGVVAPAAEARAVAWTVASTDHDVRWGGRVAVADGGLGYGAPD